MLQFCFLLACSLANYTRLFQKQNFSVDIQHQSESSKNYNKYYQFLIVQKNLIAMRTVTLNINYYITKYFPFATIELESTFNIVNE